MSLKCPKCGSPEITADTPRTVYSCMASDFEQRPGTFVSTRICTSEQFAREATDASVIPAVYADDSGIVSETISCVALSGCQDYQNGMPRFLKLALRKFNGTTITRSYIQDPDDK